MRKKTSDGLHCHCWKQHQGNTKCLSRFSFRQMLEKSKEHMAWNSIIAAIGMCFCIFGRHRCIFIFNRIKGGGSKIILFSQPLCLTRNDSFKEGLVKKINKLMFFFLNFVTKLVGSCLSLHFFFFFLGVHISLFIKI